MNITAIILSAQKQLIGNPYDLAHDVLHHNRVAENVLLIKEGEDARCDSDLLLASAWLHDIFGRNPKSFKKLLTEVKIYIQERKKLDIVARAIYEHSFGKVPTTIYSKILYDADKLEYVNKHRLTNFIQIYKNGYLKKSLFIDYVEEWETKINNVYKTLNFNTSKKLFSRSLSKAKKIMKEAKRISLQ